jgi:hypothetical protein
MSACPNCGGERWVCENHTDKAWPDECECGAGAPCPACNSAPDRWPDTPPGSTTIWDRDRGYLQ